MSKIKMAGKVIKAISGKKEKKSKKKFIFIIGAAVVAVASAAALILKKTKAMKKGKTTDNLEDVNYDPEAIEEIDNDIADKSVDLD